MHYLDNAATTLVPEEVVQAMADALLLHSGNPSSQYPYGQDGKAIAESGRAVIAKALGCTEIHVPNISLADCIIDALTTTE